MKNLILSIIFLKTANVLEFVKNFFTIIFNVYIYNVSFFFHQHFITINLKYWYINK